MFGSRIGQRPFSAALARSSAKLAGAQNALPPTPGERLLPHFPSLKQYTPAQVQTIKQAYQQAMGKYHQQFVPGAKNGIQVSKHFYDNASPQTRQLVDNVYTRAFNQDFQSQQAEAARTRFPQQTRGMSDTQAAAYNTKNTPHAQAKPAPEGLSAPPGPLDTAAAAVANPSKNLLLAAGEGAAKLAKPIVQDAVDLPGNWAETLWLAGKAGQQAQSGNVQPLRNLVNQAVQTDPVALAVQGKFKRALQAAGNHPLNTALELSGIVGPEGAISRGLGATFRSGALGRAAQEYASVGERMPLYPNGHGPTPDHFEQHVANDHGNPARGAQLVQQHGGVRQALRAVHPDHGGSPQDLRDVQAYRTGATPPVRTQRIPGETGSEPHLRGRYSRGVIANRLQKAADQKRVQENLAAGRHPQAANPEGGISAFPMRFHPIAGSEASSMLRRRVDEEVPVIMSRQRDVRDTTTRAFDQSQKAITPTQQNAETLVAARIIRHPHTVAQDIQTFLDRITAEPGRKMFAGQEATRQETIAAAKALLNDKEFLKNPGPVLDSAEGFVQHQNALEAQRVGQPGGLTEDHVNAKYIPYAITHMNADPGTPVIHPGWDQYQQALESERIARDNLGKAQSALDRSQRSLENATGHRLPAAQQAAHDARVAYEQARAEYEHEARLRAEQAVPQSEKWRDAFLVDRTSGREISAQDVKAHMAANGVREPGFFSQRDSELRPNRYFRPPVGKGGGAPRSFFPKRTGASTAEGTFSIRPDALRQQLGESAANLEAVKGFHRIFDAVGVRLKGQTASNWQLAQQAAKEMSDKTGVPMVPVRIGPLREFDQGLGRHPVDDQIGTYSERLQEAFKKPPQGGRDELGLMPKDAGDQLIEHFGRTPTGLRQVQRITQLWARNTLGTSFKWPATEATEMTTRNLLYGNGPMTWLRGHMVMRKLAQMDPEKAAIMDARINSAGVGHGVQGAARYAPPTNLWQHISQLPPMRVPSALVRAHFNNMTRFVRRIEKEQAYTALGGHARSEIRANLGLIRSMFQSMNKGAEEFARGLTQTPAQVKAAHAVEQVIGRWNPKSPAWRFLGSFAPFMQWVRVGLKFMYWTLPAHHPIKSGVAAALADMTEPQRKSLGLYDPLGLDSSAPHVKDYLQGGIEAGGKIFPFQRYQSSGAASDWGSILDQIAPQLTPAFMERHGIDWKGSALKNKDGSVVGSGERAAIVISALAEGLVPEASIAHRLADQGGTPTADDWKWILGHPSVTGARGVGPAALGIAVPELHVYKPAFEKAAPGRSSGSSSSGGGGDLQFNFGGGSSSGGSSGPSAPSGSGDGNLQFNFGGG